MIDAINDIIDEIVTGFLRGIGFILAILFSYFVLFIMIGISFESIF